MTETRLEAYDTAAGLLRNLGYEARAECDWTPPGATRPVPAIVTCAPPVIVGYAIAITAEEPEAHLPLYSAKAGRASPGKPGDPQFAWWA
jgi:hypothetical protein